MLPHISPPPHIGNFPISLPQNSGGQKASTSFVPPPTLAQMQPPQRGHFFSPRVICPMCPPLPCPSSNPQPHLPAGSSGLLVLVRFSPGTTYSLPIFLSPVTSRTFHSPPSSTPSPSPRADKDDGQEVVSGLSRGEEEARKGSSDATPPPPSGSADTSGDSEPAGEGGPFVGELRVGRAAGELGV